MASGSAVGDRGRTDVRKREFVWGRGEQSDRVVRAMRDDQGMIESVGEKVADDETDRGTFMDLDEESERGGDIRRLSRGERWPWRRGGWFQTWLRSVSQWE